jgi:hypothetical protein
MSKKQCDGLWPRKKRHWELLRCSARATHILVTSKGRSRMCLACATKKQAEHGGEILDRQDRDTQEAMAALRVRAELERSK